MADDKRQSANSKESLLTTAARAVGSALGKLAAKAGLADDSTPAKKKIAVAKQTTAAKSNRKAVATNAPRKKKVAVKKTASRLTKTK